MKERKKYQKQSDNWKQLEEKYYEKISLGGEVSATPPKFFQFSYEVITRNGELKELNIRNTEDGYEWFNGERIFPNEEIIAWRKILSKRRQRAYL